MGPGTPPETDVEEEEKPSWFSSLEPRVQRVFVIVGVVGLVVGLLGGFTVGFKVEQSLVDEAKPKSTARRIGSISGIVAETATDSLTITSPGGRRVKIKLLASLKVTKAVKASITDITVGSTILQLGSKVGTGTYDAAGIYVLPGDSTVKGLRVTAVNGGKVSVVQANAALTVNVKATTVIYKLETSSTTQIAKGSKVVANGLGVFGSATFSANEIIILDPGSALAER